MDLHGVFIGAGIMDIYCETYLDELAAVLAETASS